ncbi:MAG: hypothetical protein R6T83_02810, partial [Salinibacter sp.]
SRGAGREEEQADPVTDRREDLDVQDDGQLVFLDLVHALGVHVGGPADFDAWLGYATDDEDEVGTAFKSAFFGGLGAKLDLNDSFYLAGRFTYVGNTSEDAPDDHAAVNRVQIGFGYEVYETALLKVEGVRQVEGENSYGQVGNNWSGVTTELSLNF